MLTRDLTIGEKVISPEYGRGTGRKKPEMQLSVVSLVKKRDL